MKAVRIHQFGGPEVLTYEDVPDPKPRKDQVLVRVRACALNHLDVWVRKGLPGVNLPHILGTDTAGEIWLLAARNSLGRSARAHALLQSLCEVCGRIAESVPAVHCSWQWCRWGQL